MHRLLIGLIVTSIIVLVCVRLFKCSSCECWNSCSCASSDCCCAEPMLNNTRRIYLHSVDWCPHCKIIKPVWDAVVNDTKGSGIIFTEVDEDIAKTPGINGYPTIIMLDENGYRHKYSGGPDFTALRNWVIAPTQATIR